MAVSKWRSAGFSQNRKRVDPCPTLVEMLHSIRDGLTEAFKPKEVWNEDEAWGEDEELPPYSTDSAAFFRTAWAYVFRMIFESKECKGIIIPKKFVDVGIDETRLAVRTSRNAWLFVEYADPGSFLEVEQFIANYVRKRKRRKRW